MGLRIFRRIHKTVFEELGREPPALVYAGESYARTLFNLLVEPAYGPLDSFMHGFASDRLRPVHKVPGVSVEIVGG